MEIARQWLDRNVASRGVIGRAGYFVSVLVAGILLIAGLVVYGHARFRGDSFPSGGWQDYLPMVAMAYGSLLLLAVAVIEVRVRHVRAGTLDRLTAYLTRCQERERNELSARLHDDVGALLTALKLEIEALSREADTTSEGWERADALLARLLDEVRGLSVLLYPRMIGQVGLKYALEEMTERLCAGKLQVALRVEGELTSLDDEQSLCVLRIIQEAVINVCRHAEAHHVVITVRRDADRLTGVVDDDGRGWQHDREGMGLTLMRERIRKHGGSLASAASPQGGVRVHFEMPI